MEQSMEVKIEMVRAKVAECISLAESKFGITMPNIEIRFDIRSNSRTAGQARRTGPAGASWCSYILRFNPNHMKMGGKTWDHILNDVVPHEVAHSVCQAFPKFGYKHDAGWKYVCLALGGNGRDKYNQNDAPEASAENLVRRQARLAKTKPYIYISSTGKEIAVSKVIHSKIQNFGLTYRYNRGFGAIDRNSPVNMTKPYIVETPKVTETAAQNRTFTKVAKVKTNGMSKPAMLAAFIAGGNSFDECVNYAMVTLGQNQALATRRVKEGFKAAGKM